MVIFLMSTFIFLIVFSVFFFIRPTEDWLWRRIDHLARNFDISRYHQAVSVAGLLIIILLPLIVVLGIASLFHGNDFVLFSYPGSMYSSVVLKAALGLVFAALFVFWIGGIYSYNYAPAVTTDKDAAKGIPVALYVQGALLAMIFLLGLHDNWNHTFGISPE